LCLCMRAPRPSLSMMIPAGCPVRRAILQPNRVACGVATFRPNCFLSVWYGVRCPRGITMWKCGPAITLKGVFRAGLFSSGYSHTSDNHRELCASRVAFLSESKDCGSNWMHRAFVVVCESLRVLDYTSAAEGSGAESSV